MFRQFAVRLDWDRWEREKLSRLRLVFIPLVTPRGIQLSRRSNPSGVELNRNAPNPSTGQGTPWVGGQRLFSRLPGYMGNSDGAMQPESAALCRCVI